MIRVKRLHPNAKLPQRAHDTDLGYDLFAAEPVTVMMGDRALIRTGISIAMPDGWGLFLKDRSSVSFKQGLYVHAGVIDNGYHGEIKILIHNHGLSHKNILTGDKIAQAVPIPMPNFEVVEVDEIEEETTRGDKGFGSTGT